MCDPSLNLTRPTNCDERSSLSSSPSDTETTDNSQSDNTETPLIIPDISPTNKDLEDETTDGDRGTTVPDATDEVSDDNDDNDDNDNSENLDADSDSSNSEGGSSDSKTCANPISIVNQYLSIIQTY
ncbi:MAG: hypothetical protein WCD28_02390 [Nitrososphaeraceae archaeon]